MSGPVIAPSESFFEVVSATVQGKLMILVIACALGFVCAIVQSNSDLSDMRLALFEAFMPPMLQSFASFHA